MGVFPYVIPALGGGGGGSWSGGAFANVANGPNGSALAPTYSFSSSTGTGTYLYAGNTLGIAAGGVNTAILARDSATFSLSSNLATGNGYTITHTAGADGLTASSGSQSFFCLNPKVLQTGTAGYVGIDLDVTETSVGSGNKYLLRLAVGGSEKATLSNAGVLALPLGSASAPSIQPAGDPNTGLYFPASDTCGFSCGGTNVLNVARATQVYTVVTNKSTAGNSITFKSGGAVYMNGSSDLQYFMALEAKINQSGTAGYSVLKLDSQETGVGSGVNQFLYCVLGSVEKFAMNTAGQMTFTSVASTGNCINITATPASSRTSHIIQVTGAGANWSAGAYCEYLDASADSDLAGLYIKAAATQKNQLRLNDAFRIWTDAADTNNEATGWHVIKSGYSSFTAQYGTIITMGPGTASTNGTMTILSYADLAAGNSFTFGRSGKDLTDSDGAQSELAQTCRIKQTGTACWYGHDISPTITSEGDGTTGTGNACIHVNMPSGYTGGHSGIAGAAYALWTGINGTGKAYVGTDGDIGCVSLTFPASSGTSTISLGSTAGVARSLHYDIPVAAGGAADAALDYQLKLDGTLEAGLLAETDGSGTYRDPVFKIPYKSGDFKTTNPFDNFTAPAPVSLVNGSMVVAYDTDGDAHRLYIYSNGAWRYVALT